MAHGASSNASPGDDAELTERRDELLALARQSILGAWPVGTPMPADLEEALADLVDGLLVFPVTGAPPEPVTGVPSEDDTETADGPRGYQRIYIHPGGYGGATSKKLLNVGTNMRGGFSKYARIVLTGAGLSALAPWLGALAMIAVAADVWGDRKLKVTERQAAILWKLYERGINSRETAVSTESLRGLVNDALEEHGRDPMPKEELAAILPELKAIRCVASRTQVAPNGIASLMWWVNEDVEVSFGDIY